MKLNSNKVIDGVVQTLSFLLIMHFSSRGLSQSISLLTVVEPGGLQKSWVDPDTGHRVTRLTDDPGSTVLYFNKPAFTPSGAEMIYNSRAGIGVVDLVTKSSKLIVQGPVQDVLVGTRTRRIYFTRPANLSLYRFDIDTGETVSIATLPQRATISTVNADETTIAGTYILGDQRDFGELTVDKSVAASAKKATKMDMRLNARIPLVLFTLDLRSGVVSPILNSNDWINHVLFSPTDRTLLMYCHEGDWEKVDRIWIIRTDGTGNELIHKRTMNGEIAGHEFWDPDGKTIWYDLQRPKSEVFYLASYNVDTKQRRWLHLDRDQWSIHFNKAAGAAIFCGDGADYGQVAKAHNAEWIEMYVARAMPLKSGSSDMIHTGVLDSERVTNMVGQNWMLEPNVRFRPDGKAIIFNSNRFGASYVFEVELNKDGVADKL